MTNLKLSESLAACDIDYVPARHVLNLVNDLGLRLKKGDLSVKEKLLKYIDKYPDVPHFRNYLSTWYILTGNIEKAMLVNDETIQLFPKYLYGHLIRAEQLTDDFNLTEALQALHPDLSIESLLPHRKIFHIDEFKKYEYVVINYLLFANKDEEARQRYETLKRMMGSDEATGLNFYDIVRKRDAALVEEELEEAEERRLTPVFRKETTLPQTTDKPLFSINAINHLYNERLPLEENSLHEIMAGSREELIADLALVLKDCIQRHDVFLKDDDASCDMALHALYLIAESGAEEALPTVLDFLRQPEDFLDFWLSDILTEDVWKIIFTLGKNQVETLSAFLYEENVYTFSKIAVQDALTCVAFHYPEKEAQIEKIFFDFLTYCIQNKTNESFIDSDVIADTVSCSMFVKSDRLMEIIMQLFDENLVATDVVGYKYHWLSRWPRYKEMDEKKYKAIDSTYKELASFAYNNKEEETLEDDDEFEEPYLETMKALSSTPESKSEFLNKLKDSAVKKAFQENTAGQKKIDPKTPRNSPCPCGSGKKFKVCHGSS